MPINKENITKIHSILKHLEPTSIECVQIIKSGKEFNSGCLLSNRININGSYDFVYFNIVNFNTWKRKILDKRKKEVSAQMTIETFEAQKVTRITFK